MKTMAKKINNILILVACVFNISILANKKDSSDGSTKQRRIALINKSVESRRAAEAVRERVRLWDKFGELTPQAGEREAALIEIDKFEKAADLEMGKAARLFNSSLTEKRVAPLTSEEIEARMADSKIYRPAGKR